MRPRRRGVPRVWNGILPPRYRRLRLGPPPNRKIWFKSRLFDAAADAYAAGQLATQALALLVVLAAKSNNHGRDVYGLTLAEWGEAAGGLSESFVEKWARVLFSQGWLDKQHVSVVDAKSGQWRGRPNVYRLTVPEAFADHMTVTPAKAARPYRHTPAPGPPGGAGPRNLDAEYQAAMAALAPPRFDDLEPDPVAARADAAHARIAELQEKLYAMARKDREARLEAERSFDVGQPHGP